LDEDAARTVARGDDPLAYLLFTSGSTGRPKGTRIGHRALAAHADAAIPELGLEAGDRVLQFTSPGFDVSIEEVVPTILAGAQVVLRGDDAGRDPAVLLTEIERAAVTVLNLPSAYFHELVLHLESTYARLPRSVRLVVVGGERPSPETYARFAALFGRASTTGEQPMVRFVNAYGPTEVTITSVLCDVGAAGVPPDGRTELPIGRPFGACRAHVVRVPPGPSRARDETAPFVPRLAALKEPGELWLAGPQVAQGYLGRPDATARAFVPDPFAEEGDRDRVAYRTGDLVKRDARGQLVFLGRIDRQIKLRGHRIEPEEIEAVLLRLGHVRDAAVVLAEHGDDRALVAFVTALDPARRDALEPTAIRDALAAQLPAVMVPARVEVLPALPIAPTGKVDRDALVRRGEQILREAPRTCVASETQNDVEAWLRAAFAEVLGREDVDLEASFFEQGGHSLSAIRLVSRLGRERPDIPLTLAGFFMAPSVRALARAVGARATESAPTLVRLSARRPEIAGATPLFCVCGVHLYGSLARAMECDRPVFGAFLPVEADAITGDGRTLDVAAMARGYLELIRREQPAGPYLLAGVSFGGLLAYEMAQQLRAGGEEVRLLVLLDAILPRGLTRAPLATRLRLQVERLREDSDAVLGALRRRLDRARERVLGARGGLGPRDAERVRDELFRAAGEAYDRTIRPYRGRVVLFRARGGLGYEGEVVRWDMGWSGLVPADTPIHAVEGDHLGILREPGVSEIARVLRGHLR
jgi:amino acid adenylation domain-containing protein